MLETGSPERLLQASDLAYRAGALAVAATVDLQLLGLYGFLFETDRVVEVADRVVDVARTLDLSEIQAVALLQLAFAHAIAGRRDALESAVDEALRIAGDNAEVLALAWGHARATYSILAEDRTRATEQLDLAMGWARRVPGVSGVFPALWALLQSLEGAGSEVIVEVQALQTPAFPMNRAIVRMAEAVVAGRAGEKELAEAQFDAADALLRGNGMPGFSHLIRRLVAEAAIVNGWGDPGTWLTDAMLFFDGSGHDRVAAGCRDLLRRLGRPVPKPEDTTLPVSLRAAGVTRREADVLRLAGERLSNREMAERLYLSPRTVEKHVERLLQKLAVPTRRDLGRMARELF
jgi:DNA-binding CsgD family transcriptional regulator